MGAIGVWIPPMTYWPEVERICRKYDVLLIADEVICGFGRTGEWFGQDYFGFQADIMPIAKGLSSGYIPIGAVMFNDRVAGVLKEKGGELAHGYTYSGHPVCAAVALENIRILQDEKIVETCKNDTGPYLAQRWKELGEHPLVGEARGLGLIGGLELVADKTSKRSFDAQHGVGAAAVRFAEDEGLIVRSVMGDVVTLSPPLVISAPEIEELFDRLARALDKTLDWVTRERLAAA
jgi:putrescine aminotransferase